MPADKDDASTDIEKMVKSFAKDISEAGTKILKESNCSTRLEYGPAA